MSHSRGVYYFFESFTHQRKLMVSNWNLNHSKSSQVSRTLPSILAELILAFVLILSTCPLISKSSSPFINHLGIVPSGPITTSITITFTLRTFISSLAWSKYLSPFSLSFNLTLWYAGTAKSTIRQVLSLSLSLSHFFWGGLTITQSGRLAEIRWSVCISKSQRSLRVSFSGTDSELCIYHLFLWSN